jgi:hypothetical protein
MPARKPKPLTKETLRRRRRQSAEAVKQRQIRADRRTDQRVAAAINWNICCIPGCNDLSTLSLPRDVSRTLPLCGRHLVIIFKSGADLDQDPDVLEARKRWGRQQADQLDREDREVNNDGAEGHIYFVRQNGLVKVGWSSKLRNRLKQYGANVEILCHFPATRADETNLHRQLRPYLARGREWYEDCRLIHDVVAGYIKQHGEPTIKPYWTKPKPPVIKVRRAS